MLPSPSFNIPSIGTPHHALEEDQMIAPQAQEAQQQNRQQNMYSFGKFLMINVLAIIPSLLFCRRVYPPEHVVYRPDPKQHALHRTDPQHALYWTDSTKHAWLHPPQHAGIRNYPIIV